jgi:hypothetical protein
MDEDDGASNCNERSALEASMMTVVLIRHGIKSYRMACRTKVEG